MKLSRKSHCKINLLLNVVGQRADGFHELEMLMLPVPIFDRLDFELLGHGIELTCNQPGIPTDSSNLVCQAAESFAAKAGVAGGVRVHLEKSIPAEGGLGGGSSNAAATLLALNKLHDQPLGQATLHELAAELGSDVPFFMQSQAAVAKGRGEIIEPVAPLEALDGKSLLLVRPGFGVPTPWAYQGLAKFPGAKNRPLGQADELAKSLANGSLAEAGDRLLQLTRGAGLRQVPAAQAHQATRLGQQRGGRAHVRQRLDRFRDLPGRRDGAVAWPSDRGGVWEAITRTDRLAARRLPHRFCVVWLGLQNRRCG